MDKEDKKEITFDELNKIKNEFELFLKKHKTSIENKMYETLSSLELNYLINLSKTSNINKATIITGISDALKIEILRKLGNLNLILAARTTEKMKDYIKSLDYIKIITPIKQKYMICIFKDFAKALKTLNNDKIKQIFGSKSVSKLYKKLKKEYLFVYPEIPVSVIIKKQHIEHLFTETWHSNYFLMCRLDFVVTDQHGMPKFGVEYQGGYHESKEQKVKDDFKKLIMNEAGLEIKYFTASDL